MATKGRMGWEAIFSKGVVVDIEARVWGGRTAIQASDVGWEETEEINKALNLGVIRLMPKEATKEIWETVNRAKRILDNHSLNFAFIRGARYVPDNQAKDCFEKLRKCQTYFDGICDEFVEPGTFEARKQESLATTRQALLDATENETETVDNAMNRIESMYPTRDEVRRKFSLTWTTYVVGGPRTSVVADAVEKESESVKSVVRDMIGQVRDEFLSKNKSLLKIIGKGGKIPRTSADSALELMDRIEALNLFGDQVLAKQVDNLRRVIRESIEGTASSKALTKDLETMGKEVEKSMEQAVADAEAGLTSYGKRKITPNGKAVA